MLYLRNPYLCVSKEREVRREHHDAGENLYLNNRLLCTLILLHYRKGDLIEFPKYGSLHQYLLHLHQNGHKPINTFWWGQERVVSICSPEMLKDTIKLINKPSERLQHAQSNFIDS